MNKNKCQLMCAMTLVAMGCTLAIAGFLCPPAGEIHPSVLVLFGEVLTFTGALFGIDYHYKSRK